MTSSGSEATDLHDGPVEQEPPPDEVRPLPPNDPHPLIAAQGPLVSSRQPTLALHMIYKTADPADPVYVEKTKVGHLLRDLIRSLIVKNLAEMAPYYRTVRRDGSCGFRGQ